MFGSSSSNSRTTNTHSNFLINGMNKQANSRFERRCIHHILCMNGEKTFIGIDCYCWYSRTICSSNVAAGRFHQFNINTHMRIVSNPSIKWNLRKQIYLTLNTMSKYAIGTNFKFFFDLFVYPINSESTCTCIEISNPSFISPFYHFLPNQIPYPSFTSNRK